MRILGIETSFDETCAAVYDSKRGILSNKIYTQSFLHQKFGGIIPEIAFRNHSNKIIFVIQKSLYTSGIKLSNIQGIAYTAGPGLLGSLLVGSTVGKSLAFSLKIPAIPVNHLEGHVLSLMLNKNKPEFPFVVLLISGKHTQLILAKKIGKYQILGKSLDDSIGEVFDKVARSLGLKYPGGPLLSSFSKKGKKNTYDIPKPMMQKKNLDFSFSGLKTFVIRLIKNTNYNKKNRYNIACSFENTVINILKIKCIRALNITNCNRLAIVGGVSANKNIRKNFKKMMDKRNGKIFYVKKILCTDNAAMIAYAGINRLKKNFLFDLTIKVKPQWSLEKEINSI